MDKETQKKIEKLLAELDKYPGVGLGYVTIGCEKIANQIGEIHEELGYRKPLDSPELRARIDNLIKEWATSSLAKWHKTRLTTGGLTDQILALIIPKDKPPLLSDEEIHKATPAITHFFQYDEIYPLLKAQREADIKHYEGGGS